MTLLMLSRVYFVVLLVAVACGVGMVLWLRYKTQTYQFHGKGYKITLWEEIFKEKSKKLYMVSGLTLVNVLSLLLMNAFPLKYVVLSYIGAIILAMLVVMWYNMEHSADFKALYRTFLKNIFSIPFMPIVIVLTAFELKRVEPNMGNRSIGEVILLMQLRDIREVIASIDEEQDDKALKELHYLVYVLMVYANVHFPYLKHGIYGNLYKDLPTQSMQYMFHIRGLQVFELEDFEGVVNLHITSEEIYSLLENAKYRQYVLQTEVWRNGADMGTQRTPLQHKPISFEGYTYHIRSEPIPLEAFRAYTIGLQGTLEDIIRKNLALMVLFALSKRNLTQMKNIDEILKLMEESRFLAIDDHIQSLEDADKLFRDFDAWLGHFIQFQAVQECIRVLLARKRTIELMDVGADFKFPQFFAYAVLIAQYADNYYGEHIPVELDNILHIQYVIQEHQVT